MSGRSAPVLILTPEGRDGEVAAAVLRHAGISATVCESLEGVVPLLAQAECAIVAEEALLRSDRGALSDWIAAQPPWSDFPFILLTLRGGAADAPLTELLGNVTVLERPFHPSVLVSAVKSATRARRRQREAEHYLEERELLIRELHHRVKNTLATVQSLVRATARSSRTVADMERTLSERILSLARTHGLLVEGSWRAASLRDILWSELGAFDDPAAPRVSLKGPIVELPPEVAVAFGMAIHELATNAAKYGSLSVPQGRMEVVWARRSNGSADHIELTWCERGGPPVSRPNRTGFGSSLIERVLARQCGAEFKLDFDRAGLRFTLHMPLPGPSPGADDVRNPGCSATEEGTSAAR